MAEWALDLRGECDRSPWKEEKSIHPGANFFGVNETKIPDDILRTLVSPESPRQIHSRR
jgi:hypothetical protein